MPLLVAAATKEFDEMPIVSGDCLGPLHNNGFAMRPAAPVELAVLPCNKSVDEVCDEIFDGPRLP